MEKITYRKTLDVHKNGTQFLLQGFETADNMSRVIEISLMASGDVIDFPLERIVAMMYVTSPGATEPSINECTIKDNKVVYEVLPITTEGITEMQIKLIETSHEGAKSVLASPKFAVEVTKSGVDDDGEELKTTFTAIEDFIAKADAAYDSRLLRIELTSDCLFKAYYADGSTYETDVLQRLFLNGNVLLSESFAHGGTGIRAGEDTDNSKYYSNVSKSEALNAKNIMENSEEILEEVKLHGVYTAFSVDFTTGEVEYVSPSFKFKVNPETGELDAEGQTYSFEDEVARIVAEWLLKNGVVLDDLQAISTRHSTEIAKLQETTAEHSETLESHSETLTKHTEDIAKAQETADDALIAHDWNVDGNIGVINATSASIDKVYDTNTGAVSIVMINSGKIYLRFRNRCSIAGGTTNFDTVCTVTQCEEVVHTVTHEDVGSLDEYDETITIPLTVTKGDVITIELSCSSNVSGNYAYIQGIDLLANIETAYKYASLTDLVDEDFTLEDVVSALIGE